MIIEKLSKQDLDVKFKDYSVYVFYGVRYRDIQSVDKALNKADPCKDTYLWCPHFMSVINGVETKCQAYPDYVFVLSRIDLTRGIQHLLRDKDVLQLEKRKIGKGKYKEKEIFGFYTMAGDSMAVSKEKVKEMISAVESMDRGYRGWPYMAEGCVVNIIRGRLSGYSGSISRVISDREVCIRIEGFGREEFLMPSVYIKVRRRV